MAQNDWIVAGLNNPDFTTYDLVNIAGLTLDNTLFLEEEKYVKSDFIKNHDAFKDTEGQFSSQKFHEYYKHRTGDFLEFQTQEFQKGPQLDMFDTDRTKDSRVKNIAFNIGRHSNPDRQAIGIEGINTWSAPTKTRSELAQAEKIWDTAKLEYKDYSSNDKALINGVADWIKNIVEDPLVIAQWEEDGEHMDPITGRTKKHAKGDYKLNDKGTYYYETLNGRSPIGKEILSVFDTLSVDGEGINKYDFFDSDDVKKSVGGVIVNNVAKLLPLFTPLGGVYSAIIAAREFSKALPMLHGFVTIFSDDNTKPQWINDIAAFGLQMSGGTSDYAKLHMFSFENFGNLVADVALQWGLLKVIADVFNKVRGASTYVDDALKNAESLYKVKAKELGASAELWEICKNKYLPEAIRLQKLATLLGKDISMAYMAIISNSDLYNDMLRRGLTNTEAAAIALGSTLGMFTLNKYTGLGELFLDDVSDDVMKIANKAIKTELGDAAEAMFKGIKNSDLPLKNKLLTLINKVSNKASSIMSNFSDDLKNHTLGFAGKALGEGLEEVSEELISDVSKSMYELAGELGASTTLEDVGAWDNALARYTMSFIGGAIGGGIYYGRSAIFDGKSYKQDLKNPEMATLIRNGHANELRKAVNDLKKLGKLGSTKLSATKTSKNDKGDTVWLTTEDIKDSQNEAIANAILSKINSIEAVILNNRLNLTDDELFENMVLSEKRYTRYKKIAPLTNYYRDYNNIMNELIQASLDYNVASQTIDGTVNGLQLTDAKLTAEEEEIRKLNLAILKDKIAELLKKRDEFLSGDTSLDYTRKLNFLIDPRLHSLYLSIDREQFFIEKYGNRNIEDLTPEERILFEMDWSNKVVTTLKDEVDLSWDRFKEIEQLILPELDVLAATTEEHKQFIEESQELFSALSLEQLYASYKKYDDKLDDETDEEFENRHTKITTPEFEETDAEFELRKFNRILRVKQYNTEKDTEWANKVHELLAKVNYKVDPFTFRYLRRALPLRQKDVIERELTFTPMPTSVKLSLRLLDSNLSNVDQVEQTLLKITEQLVLSSLKSIVDKFTEIKIGPEEDDLLLLQWAEEMMEEGEELTLELVLIDPTIIGPNGDSVVPYLQLLIPILGKDFSALELFSMDIVTLTDLLEVQDFIQRQADPHLNVLHSFVSDVLNNPIFNLSESVIKLVKNPIGELIKVLAEKNGDVIPNIDFILDTILDNFDNIDDVNSLILDDQQMSDLKKVKNYLKLIEGFLYAASSNPDKHNPVGHNQVINSYAKSHKDVLLKEWKLLPEIDLDYFIIYDQEIAKYNSEIDYWINLSNSNSVNKIRKFVATDKAFSKALYDTIKSKNLTITVNGLEYNLLDGYIEEDVPLEVLLFNIEQVLYNNFLNALRESNLDVISFLEESKLFNLLIPSISNITKLQISKLDEHISKEKLTDFDLVLYFTLVLTLNPSEFYKKLKIKVLSNTDKAPIASQEYATRLALAFNNNLYKAIIKYVYDQLDVDVPLLANSMFISGVAGSGKTSVVLESLNDPNELIFIVGPTKGQTDNLQRTLHRNESYSFSDLFNLILGNQLYNDITTKFNNTTVSDKATVETEFFSIHYVNGSRIVKLKKDALTFNKTNPPKKIIVDEATYLSSLELLILDAYAEEVGATVYLAGDYNLAGYYNPKTKTESILEDLVFCVRTPKLTVSFRDNNLLKYLNLEAVRSLVDVVNENFINLSEEDLKKFWPQVLTTMSKLNFQVYNQDVLNGDLITDSLSDDLIQKILNAEGATIGFIGDPNSATFKKLQQIRGDIEANTVRTIQGLEFDFVIIDEKWDLPGPNFEVKQFLTKLYTAMTRAKTASIFIDNGLSNIIGKNTISTNKSQAPSLDEGILELLRNKLSILNLLKLLETSQEPTNNEVSTIKPLDFENPDVNPADDDLQERIRNMCKEEIKEQEESNGAAVSPSGDLLVETFTDITITGVKVVDKEVTFKTKNGDVTKTVPVWVIEHPTDGVLRNLQALYPDKTEFASYSEKQYAQRKLFDIKSSVIYLHSYDDLPGAILVLFNKSDWELSTLEIEIRQVTDFDNTHLNAYYDEPGFTINGERYIINIVLNTKLKSGKVCKFDISGLPSPEKYGDSLEKTKTKLRNKIANESNAEVKAKLQSILDNCQSSYDLYILLLTEWVKLYKAGTFNPIRLNPNTIKYNKTTWFQRWETDGKSVQLGGKIDPLTGEYSHMNLQLIHPELVFSPIYTYASKERLFTEIDPSLAGKAVILVSSDTLLKPDLLLETYVQLKKNQKENPLSSTARVRMIVLDNYGMSFGLFIDPKFITKFQKGDEERKPFRQNFTGIRMFTAMWNWRASLEKFNTARIQWLGSHNYTDQQVDALIEAELLLYRNKEFLPLLQSHGLTEEDLSNLKYFNTTICKNIPIFRLGFSEDGNGFYIRLESLEANDIYSKDKVNLLAINVQKARLFTILMDTIMAAIEPNPEAPHTTLGVLLLDENGKPWEKDLLIDLTLASHRRSLSGLLKLDGKKLVIQANNKNIAYADGEYWSMIPTLISNLVRTITYFQHNQHELSNTELECAKITLYNGETKTLLETLIGHLFSNGGIIDEDDKGLYHMMNLMFHGTHEDIHTNPILLEDAYFKHGFFISPDITRPASNKGDSKLWSFDDENGNALFYKIETTPELFTVDTNVRTSGLGLIISELYKESQLLNKEEELKRHGIDPVDHFKSAYPELSNIITNLNRLTFANLEYSLDSEVDAVDKYNKFLQDGLVLKLKLLDMSILDSIFEVSSSKGHVTEKTVGLYLNAKTGGNITEMYYEGTSAYIKVLLNGEVVIFEINSDFSVTRIGSETSSIFKQKIYEDKPFFKVLEDFISGYKDFGLDEKNKLKNDLLELAKKDDDSIKNEFMSLIAENDLFILLIDAISTSSDSDERAAALESFITSDEFC